MNSGLRNWKNQYYFKCPPV